MTATNHALTGAIIGLSLGNPYIAIPCALVSHFVCDSIPHFGFQGKKAISSKNFARLLVIDATACGILVVLLGVSHPLHWLLAAVCAFTASSPDFMWLPEFIRARRHQRPKRRRHILHFHHVIQWFQRPIGALVEVAWFGAALTILLAYTA